MDKYNNYIHCVMRNMNPSLCTCADAQYTGLHLIGGIQPYPFQTIFQLECGAWMTNLCQPKHGGVMTNLSCLDPNTYNITHL